MEAYYKYRKNHPNDEYGLGAFEALSTALNDKCKEFKKQEEEQKKNNCINKYIYDGSNGCNLLAEWLNDVDCHKYVDEGTVQGYCNNDKEKEEEKEKQKLNNDCNQIFNKCKNSNDTDTLKNCKNDLDMMGCSQDLQNKIQDQITKLEEQGKEKEEKMCKELGIICRSKRNEGDKCSSLGSDANTFYYSLDNILNQINKEKIQFKPNSSNFDNRSNWTQNIYDEIKDQITPQIVEQINKKLPTIAEKLNNQINKQINSNTELNQVIKDRKSVV